MPEPDEKFNPQSQMRHPKTDDQLTNAIYELIDQLEANGDLTSRLRNVTRESQSSVSSGDNKWKFSRNSRSYRSTGNIVDDFENGLRDQLLDTLAGGSFKKGMEGALKEFTKQFGISVDQLPHELGKQMMKSVVSSETGKKISAQIGKSATQLLGNIFDGRGEGGKAAKDALLKVGQSFVQSAAGAENLAAGASNAASATQGAATAMTAATGAAEGTAAATASTGLALGELSAVALEAIPVVGAVVLALMLLEPAIQGEIDVLVAGTKAFTKNEDMRRKRADQAQKRLEADMESMARKPFEILEKATEEWYNTWDSNLRTIGQTQGYDKESVYALYEGYADRLRNDNLDSVINATDIVGKLSSVLDTGLSGEAAEEFAYIATKLNAAIPTQDFFGYAEAYTSIAANAVAQGESQRAALDKANAELERFASNLVYSSRELADGFTVGLKDGSTLFKDAVQIAQSAKTYNASDISGTLTSVSAIIGSVAPDLAGALVDNVVQAAIGGNNNSQLVALRSLAGINAGNTEFLREMASNPQAVFTNLFTTLANMQNMSPDNYMEVAEGLADVFGIDKAAFARVDFNYLAQAIASMNTNNQSLEDNLKLLESGQTTTSAEQLKAQEINSVILEEGLAYVIDSEAGRMIQQHMWDEQLANQLQENTYAVELQGAVLSYIEGIRETITNILNFLNPIGFIASGVTQLVANSVEASGMTEDIAETLLLGAVGTNAKSFSNLTSYGKDLGLTTSLVEMMGGTKGLNGLAMLGELGNALNEASDGRLGAAYELGSWALKGGLVSGENFNTRMDEVFGISGTPMPLNTLIQAGVGVYDDYYTGAVSKSSRYDWGSVGKSTYAGVQNTSLNSKTLGNVLKPSMADATQNAIEASNKKVQQFLDSAAEASKTMSYDAWIATSKQYGIADFETALADFGRTEEEVKGYFQANQAKEGALKEEARKADEQLFRDETRGFWDYSSGSSGIFQTAMWFPFFGDGQKYDTRMTSVDDALSNIQARVGTAEKHTVIGGIEELSTKLGDDTNYTVIGILTQMRGDIATTFISTSSAFQKCLADWIRYIAASSDYTKTISKSSAWNDLKSAEADQQTQATLALANALGVFSAEELKKMDPQLQTNALLGEIVILLQTIQQQNNQVGGGMSLIDSISALGFGVTTKT